MVTPNPALVAGDTEVITRKGIIVLKNWVNSLAPTQKYFFFNFVFRRFLSEMQMATVIFVMRVCPSELNNSAPTGRIFVKFRIYVFFFRKSVDKIQVYLKFA